MAGCLLQEWIFVLIHVEACQRTITNNLGTGQKEIEFTESNGALCTVRIGGYSTVQYRQLSCKSTSLLQELQRQRYSTVLVGIPGPVAFQGCPLPLIHYRIQHQRAALMVLSIHISID